MRSLSSRPERNEWKHGISVGFGSAAKPTNTVTKADGSTKGAVSGSVATMHEGE